MKINFKEKAQLKQSLLTIENIDYFKYCEMRLLKLQREEQQHKALCTNRAVILRPVRYQGDDLILFKAIDLSLACEQDYNRLQELS